MWGIKDMLLYDIQTALLSMKRNLMLTALMIGAIAAGIGASMVTITLYHTKSGNPIWWKNDRLYAVALDLRDSEPEFSQYDRHPEYPPLQLTYRDAQALFQSDIPTRKVMMFRARQPAEPVGPGGKAFSVMTRVTTADFFAMFDVPFKYGTGWTQAADQAPDAVVVLSKSTNDKLFNGANSVGRTVTLDSRKYRVVGVLDYWLPQPKFYDLNNSGFDVGEEVYLPFGWTEPLQIRTAGNINCMKNAKVNSSRDLLTTDCVWLQFWAELPNTAQRERFQQFLDNYVGEQKKLGRFPRPLNNRLSTVSRWLEMNDVVDDDSRIQIALALMFLAICILNTVGLMLAKFMGAASIAGLRRALGATRADIIRQHLIEVVLLGLVGGIAGIGIAIGGLWLLRHSLYLPMLSSPTSESLAITQSLTHLDGGMAALAIFISLLTGILAGLYPAWRIGRLSPAVFLKTQ